MARNGVVAQRTPESIEEWRSLEKRHRFVTRGELLFFLQMHTEALDAQRAGEAATRRERRWYRRLARAIGRRIRRSPRG